MLHHNVSLLADCVKKAACLQMKKNANLCMENINYIGKTNKMEMQDNPDRTYDKLSIYMNKQPC